MSSIKKEPSTMNLNSNKNHALMLILILPNLILQADELERCVVLNKRITELKERFNESDENIIKRHKEGIQKQLSSLADEMPSLSKKRANANQLLNEARKNEERRIISFSEFLSDKEKELAQPDDIILRNKKEILQSQISMGNNRLTQIYQEQLTKQSDENVKKPLTLTIEKNLNELLKFQLLPDSELLKIEKTEIQNDIAIIKNEIEQAKKIVQSDALLIDREQKGIDQSIEFLKDRRERLQKQLDLPDQILLQNAKDDIQQRFQMSMRRAFQNNCPVDL